MAQASFEVRDPNGSVHFSGHSILASARACQTTPKKVADLEARVLNEEAQNTGENGVYRAVSVRL